MGARIGIEANLEFIGREYCWELSRRPYFTIGVHFVRFIVLRIDIRTGVFLRREDVNNGRVFFSSTASGIRTGYSSMEKDSRRVLPFVQ